MRSGSTASTNRRTISFRTALSMRTALIGVHAPLRRKTTSEYHGSQSNLGVRADRRRTGYFNRSTARSSGAKLKIDGKIREGELLPEMPHGISKLRNVEVFLLSESSSKV